MAVSTRYHAFRGFCAEAGGVKRLHVVRAVGVRTPKHSLLMDAAANSRWLDIQLIPDERAPRVDVEARRAASSFPSGVVVELQDAVARREAQQAASVRSCGLQRSLRPSP